MNSDEVQKMYEQDDEEYAVGVGDRGTCGAVVRVSGKPAGLGEPSTVCGMEITLKVERTALMADGTDGRGQGRRGRGGVEELVWRHTDVAFDHMHKAELGGPA